MEISSEMLISQKRTIEGLRKARTRDPVFLLYEVDKLGAAIHGDPSAALLEVLDPAQNGTFQDNYQGDPFDLSEVLFIATANVEERIPGPLHDRMDVLRLSGYTEAEKLAIARKHLLGRQRAAAGLKASQLKVSVAALREVISGYTREAGVRNLERELAKIARKTVTRLVSGEADSVTVGPESLEDFLGVRKFRFGEIEEEDRVGMTTGLAWTEVGGELMQVEAVRVPGKGKVSATGKLGDVMNESIQAAEYFIKSRASS